MKLFLLGGFLGSGKTTAIYEACKLLMAGDSRVAVITNDQGTQLVDSAFVKGHQIASKEVVNGCFCCNYHQLEEGIQSLSQDMAPDIIFAESVGSCADIVATVVKPLIKFHPDLEIVYTVFADAINLLKWSAGQPVFTDDDVNYIFEKQLEEAELLVVNKIDLLSGSQKEIVSAWISKMYSGKTKLFQNSLQQADVSKWLDTMMNYSGTERNSLEIDYDKYGAGEAKLAWLDDEITITAEHLNAEELATALINKIYGKIKGQYLPIGHLKFLMRSGGWQRKISFTSLNEPLLKQTASPRQLDRLNLLINARVQASPGELSKIINDAYTDIMQSQSCYIESKKRAAFQPGFPRPAYRISNGQNQ